LIGAQAEAAKLSWNLGLLYEQRGDLAQAISLMQTYVDFLQQIGHPDVAQRTARIEEVKHQLMEQISDTPQTPHPWWQFWK
jgi:hypothetical protein